jgi:hypothetical protein
MVRLKHNYCKHQENKVIVFREQVEAILNNMNSNGISSESDVLAIIVGDTCSYYRFSALSSAKRCKAES